MPTRTSDEKAVGLSVCLSVKCMNCDKMEERSAQIFIPYKRSFSLVFGEEEWLVGGDPFYLKFWVNQMFMLLLLLTTAVMLLNER